MIFSRSQRRRGESVGTTGLNFDGEKREKGREK